RKPRTREKSARFSAICDCRPAVSSRRSRWLRSASRATIDEPVPVALANRASSRIGKPNQVPGLLASGLCMAGGCRMGKSHEDPAVRDLDEWQVAETLAALEEARAGDFATEEDVRAVFEKWAMSGRLSALDRLADDRERELDSGGAEAVPLEDAIARLEARFRGQS